MEAAGAVSTMVSQSFIHQGFSSDIAWDVEVGATDYVYWRRNPLFIKAFLLTLEADCEDVSVFAAKSQSFIHQGFSSDAKSCPPPAVRLNVAILYSSRLFF